MQASAHTSGSGSLLHLSDEFLARALALRDGRGFGALAEVREGLTGCLARLDEAGLGAGIDHDTLAATKFPLVAFADEIILNSNWEHRETWRDQPLQLQFFGERMAGTRFFERLEQLRQDPASYGALLEVYHCCLTLGFQGRYHVAGKQELERLIVELRQQTGLAVSDPKAKLSPHGSRRDRYVAAGGDGFPFWRIAGIAAGGLLVLFLIFFFWINHGAGSAVDALPRPNY